MYISANTAVETEITRSGGETAGDSDNDSERYVPVPSMNMEL